MFTVKATYGTETRRFTFPGPVLFPTYKELHLQLVRLFPLNHRYYLSRLIFSPDASKPGRILIGKEVRSAKDYESYIAPLRRLWPNPLLRFIIFDEINLQIASSVTSDRMSLYSVPTIRSSDVTGNLSPPVATPQSYASFLHSQSSAPPSPPPASLKYRSPCPSSSIPPDFLFVHEHGVSRTVPCCPITKGKADLEILLSSFKVDLEQILQRTFGTDYVAQPSAPLVKVCPCGVSDDNIVPLQAENPVNGDSNNSQWCFVCRTSFAGVWYGCIKCPWHAICPGCFSESHSAHTLSFGPSHIIQQRSTNGPTQVSTQVGERTAPHGGASGTSPLPRASSSGSTDGSTHSVHRGVTCDECEKTVVGVRHKCLDCPDYDLCTPCIESGALKQHNPFHEFFDIEIPGRVYVHTVLSGDRNGLLGSHLHAPEADQVAQQDSAVIPTNPPVRHFATCNLCDSAIVGERYKCIVCPDFDTCASCFRITAEQHPSHGFVRVSKPEDLMMRDSVSASQVVHPAECDSCHKTIRGTRYKCMHPSCPDFDLCSDCEAFPIPVHPPNHAFLKLKTADAVLSVTYRAGQTQTTDKPPELPLDRGDPTPFSVSPLAIQTELPEVTPVVASNQVTHAAEESQAFAEEFLSPLDSPRSDVPGEKSTSVTVAPLHLVDVAEPPTPPRSIRPPLDSCRQLCSGVFQELMDLNVVQAPEAEDSVVDVTEMSIPQPVIREPLVAEAPLLATSVALIASQAGELHIYPVSPVSGTKSIIDRYRTPSPVISSVLESRDNSQREVATPATPQESYLDSVFVGDTNVPDGQIFPPGAEFVKGWHVMNNGGIPWPPTTEIQFVAGDMFAPECSTALKAKVGVVHRGRGLDIWTGDLKAPDVPGRYVGYWRLNDGQGNFFGNSMWIDLIVADHCSDPGDEHSLASSSMIMPSADPANSVDVSRGVGRAVQPSLLSTETTAMDGADEPEFDISSVSLVSVPSSDDEDGEWQDTRTHSEPLEYVVLYDSNSEE